MISQYAVDRIIEFEVSSRTYYERHYQHLEWPGLNSGPTGGIGYDFGQASPEKIRRDWGDVLPKDMVDLLVTCSGWSGAAGKRKTDEIGSRVKITWDQATRVFLERDVPEWEARVLACVPGAKDLPPDARGAEVSVAYNRGASFDRAGDRYAEMRAIKAHTDAGPGQWARVPGDFRSMKRLWPKTQGLRERREVEAKMFERGLAAQKAPAPAIPLPPPRPPIATEAPERTLPPPAPGAKEHGAAAATAATAAEAAHQSGLFGLPWPEVAAGVVIIVIAAVIAWYIVRSHTEAQPTLARAKD